MTLDVGALRAAEFPWMDSATRVYLNSGSTGPIPARTRKAIDAFNDLRQAPWRMPDSLLFDTLATSRALAAQLIGATPQEIALSVNTSYGINVAAGALPLGRGDVVVLSHGEFPANVYPWMALAARRGATVRLLPLLPNGLPDEAALLAAVSDPRVKIIAVSWVGFSTGYRVDLVALGAACRAHNVHLVVDAIQGLGIVPLDIRTVQPAVLSCGAQKWLLSPWGSGFTYVRRDLVSQLEPPIVSWMAVQGSDDFHNLVHYDMTWRDDARRFEFVTVPYQDLAGMNASLAWLLELGIDAIDAHVRQLADRMVQWAQASGVRLVTPAAAAQRAGIVCVAPRDSEAASARLTAEGVSHSLREGAIRLSLHCFNTVEDVERALDVIGGKRRAAQRRRGAE